jgi:hypothetical protein
VKIRATADLASGFINIGCGGWQGALLRSSKYFLLLATSHIQLFDNPSKTEALWQTNIVSSHFFCPEAFLALSCYSCNFRVRTMKLMVHPSFLCTMSLFPTASPAAVLDPGSRFCSLFI